MELVLNIFHGMISSWYTCLVSKNYNKIVLMIEKLFKSLNYIVVKWNPIVFVLWKRLSSLSFDQGPVHVKSGNPQLLAVLWVLILMYEFLVSLNFVLNYD